MIKYEAGGIAPWLNKLGGFDDTFKMPFLRRYGGIYGISLSPQD